MPAACAPWCFDGMHSFACSATTTSSVREAISRLMRGKAGHEVVTNSAPPRLRRSSQQKASPSRDVQENGEGTHVPPDLPSAPGFVIHNSEVMYLLQIYLPLYDNEQQLLPAVFHEAVRMELTEKFGEISVHVRSPAEGRWVEPGQEPQDEIVIYELMTTMLDESWWRAYQKNLEARFHQEEIVIRVLPMGL